jgi:RimJ/RimL family protein N-acetyltransferase
MSSWPWQPTLAGERLLLRPLLPEDWEALYAVAADPGIWAGHPAHDRWQEPVFRRFFADTLESRGALLVVERATGAAIGHSRFDGRRAGPGEIEIGWTFLARSLWGGDSNREMKRLMVGHALGHVARAIFLVGESNLRSRRAMEKVGARLTPRVEHFEMAGRPEPHLTYAIDGAGFAAGPLARA